MKIGFIFTNFNNTAFTEKAVLSILESDASMANILIVDNASSQEHKNALITLEKKYEMVDVIYNEKNMGYFKGLNVGIRYAQLKLSQVLCWVIGNNDLIFSKDIYSSILRRRELWEKYPVISPSITTLDGVPQNPHVVSKISKPREFIYDLYYSNYYLANIIMKLAYLTRSISDRKDELQHELAQEIYQGYGACYILTTSFFENFEELWSPTFLMYEEYFLSKQLDDKGFKIFYEPTIKIQHHLHSSTDQLPSHFRWQLCKDAHREYRKYVKTWR